MAKSDGRSKSAHLRAEVVTPEVVRPGGEVLVIVVDGREYPLDPGALSAVDEDRLRAVSASKLTITAVMESLRSGLGGISDVAAFCYLSECQAGNAPKWSAVAGSITLASDVEMSEQDLSDPE